MSVQAPRLNVFANLYIHSDLLEHPCTGYKRYACMSTKVLKPQIMNHTHHEQSHTVRCNKYNEDFSIQLPLWHSRPELSHSRAGSHSTCCTELPAAHRQAPPVMCMSSHDRSHMLIASSVWVESHLGHVRSQTAGASGRASVPV